MEGEIVIVGAHDDVKSVSTIEYIWEVPNFSTLFKEKIYVFQHLYGDSKRAEKWELYMKYLKKTGDVESRVEIGVQLIEAQSTECVQTECQFSFLNAESKNIFTVTQEQMLLRPGKALLAKFPYKGFIDPPFPVVLNGDILRLYCKVSTETITNLKIKRDNDTEFSASKQFKSFLTTGDFADTTIKTKTNSFPVCKVILAAHSPVFRAMFSSGMKESTGNIVKIEDFPDEAVRGLLEFIYSGETQLFEENSADLLKISDKYQVMELKMKVESILLGQLNYGNAIEILILSHFYSPTTLKPRVIDFVRRFLKEIKERVSFEQVLEEYPDLLRDLHANGTSADK